jgi:predicted NAD/FAD-binding protein
MKLKISDRLAIIQVLPEKDEYVNLCYKRDVLKKIEFSAEELKNHKIKVIPDGDKAFTTWTPSEDETEIEFKAGEITYVMSKLKELSDSKQLASFQLNIYEIFSKL